MKNLNTLILSFIVFVLTGTVVSFLPHQFANATNAVKVSNRSAAKPTGDALSAIDQSIRSRDYAKAQSLVDAELAKNSNSFDALWRQSRVTVFATDLKEKKDQEAGYQKALEQAQAAIQVKPDQSWGHLRRAIASGKLALFKGILEAKEYVGNVRDSAQKAIELNSSGQEALALSYYVLGRTHLKLTDTPAVIRKPIGLGWGNLSEAEANLKKATELNPNSPMIWLEYAKAMKKLKKDAEFKAALEQVKKLPALEPGDLEAKSEMTGL
jgi:tetratricopeptide (TPR) repeat protein